jgi:YidC/Oxa1 family membrane protein insertase
MENQGKRLLMAVGLALGVMMVFQLIWKPKDEDKKKPAAASGSALVQGTVKPTPPPIATVPEVPATPEEKIVLDFPGKVKATFSTFGGALVSWQLADSKYKKDASTQNLGELLPNRVGTGSFFVDFPRSDVPLPKNVEWKGTKVSDTQVKYTLAAKPFTIEKEFTVDPDAYAVRMVVKVAFDLPAGQVVRQSLAVSSFARQDPKADLEGSRQVEARAWSSAAMRGDGELAASNIKDLIEAPRYEADVTWGGFEHPYMMQAYSPRRAQNEKVEKFSYAIGSDGIMRSDLVFPTVMLKAGDPPMQREVVAYLGPKSYKSLEAAQTFAQYHTGFPDTIDFGWFGVIGKPLLWLLLKFYHLVGNWAIAIMMLTFLVKAATLYWTTKSMRSMKAMASLAPSMKALQEKYKDDRQRLQAETMALYKQHGVNPIAGCLPIFLQMPIWIALYRMLSNAGELYQEPFITGWINDLTATDPYHILPIVLVVTMFIQARMTPATGDSRQQKFLQYGMPLMFGVMSFFFPSGLTIYIFTNTVLSALHSIYMNRFDKKSLALMAQMKKQQEDQAAAAAKIASGKTGGAKAKPVIDTTATEADDSDEPAAKPAGGSVANRPAGQRKKKKKKR